MTFRPVRPGTPFRDVITSKLINDLTRQISPPERLSGTKIDVGNRIEVLGQLDRGDDTDKIYPFQVALLREPYRFYDTGNMVTKYTFKCDPLYRYNVTDHGWLPQWGIAQEQIDKTSAGRILITGMSWLQKEVPYPTTNIPFYRNIEIVNGQMVYGVSGRAEVIGTIGGLSIPACLVNLSKRSNSTIMGVTSSSGIAANSSGNFSVRVAGPTGWEAATPNVTLTAYNFHPTNKVEGNKNIVCVDYEGRWVVIFEAC